MNKGDKELLLKDLCARLPYGVNVERLSKILKIISIRPSYKYCVECELEEGVTMSYDIDDIKPYLRPMSSMTEEEKKELKTLFDAEEITSDSICYLEGGTLEEYLSHISYYFCSKIIDWLNAHHFDYRGLIERGLAIEVTEENNPYK